MAVKKPLVLTNGQIEQLQAGDTTLSSDIALSLLAPSTDETIAAGCSAIVVRSYKIASGKKLIIQSGSRFRIL